MPTWILIFYVFLVLPYLSQNGMVTQALVYWGPSRSNGPFTRQYVQVRSRVYGLVLHIAILLGMSVK